jgi:uncharacterized protein YegP (UPF0339 family)
MIRFEIKAAASGKWYFVLHVPGAGRSGRVLIGERLHGSKAEVEQEIEAVRGLAMNENAFERQTGRHDQHYFVLKDAAGVVGSCDMYDLPAGRNRAIVEVKNYGSKAPIG